MDRCALVLGCGNIAARHLQALKRLKFKVHVYDTDERKARYFCDLHSVKLHRETNERYQIVAVCVPYLYRDVYFNNFYPILDRAPKLIIEKPLRNIDGECQEFVRDNIKKIWTPYLRIFEVPALEKPGNLIIRESRGYLYSSDSFVETIFDLFPHWLSIVVKLGINPSNYIVSQTNERSLNIELSDGTSRANIFFSIGEKSFEIFADNRKIPTPQNNFSMRELLQFPRYYLCRMQGGWFMQFYKAVCDESHNFRHICDKIFDVTSMVKVNDL